MIMHTPSCPSASISPLSSLPHPCYSVAQVEAQSNCFRRSRTLWEGEDRRSIVLSERRGKGGKRRRQVSGGVSVLEAAAEGWEETDASVGAGAGAGVEGSEAQEDDTVDVVVSGLLRAQAAGPGVFRVCCHSGFYLLHTSSGRGDSSEEQASPFGVGVLR